MFCSRALHIHPEVLVRVNDKLIFMLYCLTPHTERERRRECLMSISRNDKSLVYILERLNNPTVFECVCALSAVRFYH